MEENNYYPFGLKHKGYNNMVSSNGNSTAQKFKYNGVELEESLGLNLYEMDFRQYDPAIARFTSIDPVIHYSMSTYTAFDNNPIFWGDPSGAYSIITTEWMQENGLDEEDFITVYQVTNDDSDSPDGSNNNSPDDWFVNKKTGEVHHDENKKKGDEKKLGEDWEHLAEEDKIDDGLDAIAGASKKEDTGITYSLQDAIKLMNDNGFVLAAKKLLKDITVKEIMTVPNPRVNISITQTNIVEIWLDLTYVKSTAVPYDGDAKILQDISYPQGYRQYQRVNRTYSNNLFTRIMNKGKSIHSKGSADSAGSSLTIFVGWKGYDGPLLKFK